MPFTCIRKPLWLGHPHAPKENMCTIYMINKINSQEHTAYFHSDTANENQSLYKQTKQTLKSTLSTNKTKQMEHDPLTDSLSIKKNMRF